MTLEYSAAQNHYHNAVLLFLLLPFIAFGLHFFFRRKNYILFIFSAIISISLLIFVFREARKAMESSDKLIITDEYIMCGSWWDRIEWDDIESAIIYYDRNSIKSTSRNFKIDIISNVHFYSKKHGSFFICKMDKYTILPNMITNILEKKNIPTVKN